MVCTEDEECISLIKRLVPHYDAESSVFCFRTIFSLVTWLYDEVKGEADVLYMDEQVAGESGVEAARDLQLFFPELQLVFLIKEAAGIENFFRAHPVYLLKKPISEAFLLASFERVREELSRGEEERLTVVSRGMITRIRISGIVYIESQGRKLYIYTEDLLREVNMTMEKMLELLPENFFQCHRSYIVNVKKICQVLPGEVKLSGNRILPVARSRYEELKNRMKNK